ncbi:ABC transporter ATP-binding protein [Paenibacillus bovis]|uniref:ABC transporter ATP-binding protein n=1 Tax=Paenibacillus bovis TaxID=1616788 RepID=A0A172ZEL4_9BACL|nr:ABC transporter ATP-binding protein [Paenibacillus bovis]ANF96075.1 ABC transporter ATP-binding protein [Paenibacillus bovis]
MTSVRKQHDQRTGEAVPVVELRQVGKAYSRKPVLHDINWQVYTGEYWGIIGPNGSGKTTLLQLISGMEQPNTGSVLLEGRDIGSYSRRRIARFTAVLGQEGLAPLHYPVREVLNMGRYPYQSWLGRDELDTADELIDQIMDRLDLRSLADRPLDQLSGGQRQRVAFGKVMAQQPRLLLLDEPTTYLDIAYQIHFMEWLDEWRRESGITIIAVLHDLNLAARYCDRLLALNEGQMIHAGTPQQLMQEEKIRDLFRVEPAIVHHPDIHVPQLLLKRQ